MESCNRLVKLGRRQFLRGGATTAAATVVAGIIPQRADATPALARITYPSTKLVNVKDLKVDAPADPIPRQGFARGDHQARPKGRGWCRARR